MDIKIFYLYFFILTTFLPAKGENWSLPTPQKGKLKTELIPYPEKISMRTGKVHFSSLQLDVSGAYNPQYTHWLQQEFAAILTSLQIPGHTSKNNYVIRLESMAKLEKEAYELLILPKGVTIRANGYAGYFNALQTLRQLFQKESDNSYSLPCGEIKDAPAFRVRGIMLDVGRNYMPISLIKAIVRKLSHYKINVLHLHLTDDPGWRIEIKQHPELTEPSTFWKTRQPGKYYTQQEIKELCAYCASLNIRVIPEIDMPGHSEAFRKAVGTDMQTDRGMQVLKEVLDEVIPLFQDSLFHIGSDETQFKNKDFMPEMIRYIRAKGKEVVVWYPGYVPDTCAVRMCWGENEAGISLDKSAPYIDCNGFYLDWMDAQGGVVQTFFQQPCEEKRGNNKALGAILCVWTDGALSSGRRILEQYPLYPCALTFAERVWRGNHEKRKDLMACCPSAGTKAGEAFAEFEDRLIYHRDHYFQGEPFAYVKQSGIKWRLIGPFNHHGKNDTSFEPEHIIKNEYKTGDTILQWNKELTYGGVVQIRNLYSMFNMHRGKFMLDHWPTAMSSAVGKNDGTCYALAYIQSPKEQEIYLMFGLNGMWGHSGGYRSARAPEQGSWDYSGGDIWLNGERIAPPHWKFESLPWTGWGQGRIEVPLTEEGYFFRPPVKIKLKKGINQILVRSVFGHWKGDDGERKWQFCCIPVNWDGIHYTEVKDLKYLDLYPYKE